MTPDQILTAAHQRVRETTAEVARRQAALESVLRGHDVYRRERDEAQSQSDAARPGLAVAAAEVLSDAETVLAASGRQVHAAEREVEAAQQNLSDAHKAVKSAAREVLLGQMRGKYERFGPELESFMRLRAQLLAAFIVMPGALSHREWSRLGHLPIATAAEMGISMEAFAHDIDYNPRPQRAEVNVYAQDLRERLAQLERGAEVPASAPTAEAA